MLSCNTEVPRATCDYRYRWCVPSDVREPVPVPLLKIHLHFFFNTRSHQILYHMLCTPHQTKNPSDKVGSSAKTRPHTSGLVLEELEVDAPARVQSLVLGKSLFKSLVSSADPQSPSVITPSRDQFHLLRRVPSFCSAHAWVAVGRVGKHASPSAWHLLQHLKAAPHVPRGVCSLVPRLEMLCWIDVSEVWGSGTQGLAGD
jgi:hypothetical protein